MHCGINGFLATAECFLKSDNRAFACWIWIGVYTIIIILITVVDPEHVIVTFRHVLKKKNDTDCLEVVWQLSTSENPPSALALIATQ